MKQMLSTDDHKAIGAAIEAAERTTSGEILCVVAHRAANYTFVPVAAGLLGVVLVPAVMALLVMLGHAPFAALNMPVAWLSEQTPELVQHQLMTDLLIQTSLMQVAAFVVLALVCEWAPLKLALVPGRVKRRHAHAAAMEQFLKQGMLATSARTGVLIYVALGEHYAEVIADEGIYTNVEPKVWDETVKALTAAIGRGEMRAGLVAAIATCGKILAPHFPRGKGDTNELADVVVEV